MSLVPVQLSLVDAAVGKLHQPDALQLPLPTCTVSLDKLAPDLDRLADGDSLDVGDLATA